MNVWEWFAETVPAGAVASAGGVAAFVAAILGDRLLTRGQHDRRMADAQKAHELVVTNLKETHTAAAVNLKEAHVAAIAELVRHHDSLVEVKDKAYSELKESRDYYRQARLVEVARADKATDQLAEVAELAKLTTHLLGSFHEAAKDATP